MLVHTPFILDIIPQKLIKNNRIPGSNGRFLYLSAVTEGGYINFD